MRTSNVLQVNEHCVARAVSVDHEPSTSRMVAELLVTIGYSTLIH